MVSVSIFVLDIQISLTTLSAVLVWSSIELLSIISVITFLRGDRCESNLYSSISFNQLFIPSLYGFAETQAIRNWSFSWLVKDNKSPIDLERASVLMFDIIP